MNVQKHIGTLKTTGSRVYVVMRELPQEKESCLVCYSDSLPERYAYKVSDIVTGVAQTHPELYEVFQQNILEKTDMLTELHKMGYLKKVPVANVKMAITRDTFIDLSVLNESISENNRMKGDKISGFNPMKDYDNSENVEQYGGVVAQLLSEAQQHKEQAELLFQRAYEIDPTAKPEVEIDERTTEEDGYFTIKFENNITQAKAIEMVKSYLRELKEQQKAK